VSVIGKKRGKSDKNELIHATTQDALKRYIEKSGQDKKYLDINKMVNDWEPIAIWGAGSYTSRLLGATNLNKCNIQMFIDNDENKQGMKLMDKFICGADKLNGFNGKIIIASAIHSNDIVNQIGQMGLNNEIIIL